MKLIEGLAANPSVVARRLGDETVLVHLGSNRIYNLNASATRLWELTRAGYSATQIGESLCSEFDVDPSTVEHEMRSTLDQLVEHQLLLRA